MRKIIALITGLFFVIQSGVAQTQGENLFDNSKIHEVKFTSLFESLTDTLTNNYVLSFGIGQMQIRKIPYAPVLVTIDGTALDTVGVRYKGFNSWWSSVKKPIRIDFNKYKDLQYDGLRKLNLHNGSGDPSFIRENISYNILRSLGIKAPRTAYTKVFIDEQYIGLYRLVEQVDNDFLDVNFDDHKGNLYAQQSKGSGGYGLEWFGTNQQDYYEVLQLENHQQTNDWSSFIHFLDVLNNAPDATFQQDFEAIFAVDEYLQILAFEIVINNWDWYGTSGRNYYLAEVNGKFHWIPWDYNLSWRENPGNININPEDYPVLIRRLLKVPAYNRKFLRKYCELLPLLSEQNISAMVDHDAALIDPFMLNDPFPDYTYEAFTTNLETTWDNIPGVKEHAAQRYNDITTTLASLHLDCSVVTHVPEDDQQAFEIYPIPADGYLHIESSPNAPAGVTILNGVGQVVLRKNLTSDEAIDIRHLSCGYYFVNVRAQNKTFTRLLLIER